MNDGFPFHQFLKLDSTEKDFKNNPNNINNLNAQPLTALNQNNSQNIEDLHHKILFFLSNSMDKKDYETYFKNNFYLVNIQGKTAEFSTLDKQHIEIIEEKFWNILSESVLKAFGSRLNLVLSININTGNYLKNVNSQNIENSNNSQNQMVINTLSPHKNKPNSAKDHFFKLDLTPSNNDLKNQVESRYIESQNDNTNSNIDSRKTFENFVVGPSNNMAFASCIAAAKNPGKNYPTVYIHSKSGLGKTHLLHAIGNHIHNHFPHLKVLFTTAQNFLQEMVESIRENKSEQFRRKYTELIDVLMIDDIHELKNKQGTQNAFFHIFNDLYSKGKQLFFTSDKTPKEIDGIEERIRTRLSWGLVLDIQQPDLETRIAILKKKAHEEDFYLADDVITLIASSIKDNIRELEGSLIKLAAYSSIFKQDIDVEVAKRELKLDEMKDPSDLNLDKITKAISLYFKIPIADLKSKSRIKEVANARHIAMYLSYKLLKTNYSEIGKFFGNRDHSTVLIGVRKISTAIKTNHSLSHSILEVENNL
jgi:chromosomal replication initiator protein